MKDKIIHIIFILILCSVSSGQIFADADEFDSFDNLELPQELLSELGEGNEDSGEQNSEDTDTSVFQSEFLEQFEIEFSFEGSYNSIRKSHPLNPDEKLITYNDREIVSKADVLWFPKITENLTFRTRNVAEYEYTRAGSETDDKNTNYFLEGYFQWINDQRTFTLGIGKEKVDWGVSSGWTPVNILVPLPQKDNIYDEDIDKEGLAMVHIEYSNYNITANCILAQLKETKDSSGHERQSALKVSTIQKSWEFGLINHQANNIDPSNGLYFSGMVSDTVELHGEWVRTNGRNRQILTKVYDGYYKSDEYTPTYYSLKDDSRDTAFDKYVIGTKYTFPNDSNLTLEYYHTDHGYTDSEWDKFKDGIKEANRNDAWDNSSFNSATGNRYAGYLYSVTGIISKTRNKDNFDLRQNYLYLMFYSGESENLWEWSHFFRFNLDDNSQSHTSVLNKSWTDHFKTEFTVVAYRGDKYSEYGLSPFHEIVSLTAKLLF